MRTKELAVAGWAAVLGGLLFAVAAIVQFRLGLFDHDAGFGYVAHQVAALFSIVLFVVALAWLGRARVAGDGRYARTVLALFAAGWAVIGLGAVLNLANTGGSGMTADLALALPAVGGGLNTLTGLLAGVAVVRARRLPGWRRWSVLAYALYYLIVLSLPVAISGQEPSMFAEVGWGLLWVGVGVAALTVPPVRRVDGNDPSREARPATSGPSCAPPIRGVREAP